MNLLTKMLRWCQEYTANAVTNRITGPRRITWIKCLQQRQALKLWVIRSTVCVPEDLTFPRYNDAETNDHLLIFRMNARGPGSSFGIATAYRLDGPGIESRWGGIFCTCPERPWGPPSLLYNGYRVFPGGKVLPGRDGDPSTPSSAEV